MNIINHSVIGFEIELTLNRQIHQIVFVKI